MFTLLSEKKEKSLRTVNGEARRAKKIERMETASSAMRKTDLPLSGKKPLRTLAAVSR